MKRIATKFSGTITLLFALSLYTVKSQAFEEYESEQEYPELAMVEDNICMDCGMFFQPEKNLKTLIRLKEDLKLTEKQVSKLKEIEQLMNTLIEDFEHNDMISDAPQPLTTWLEREIFLQERTLRLTRKAQHLLEQFNNSLDKETREKISKLGLGL